MQKIDLRNFNGKNAADAIVFAENLSKKDLEGKINAHRIYSFLIEQIPNIYQHPHASVRGHLRKKLWDLERQFHWNESFYSQFGQDKFIYEFFFKNFKNGFFVEIGAYDGISGSNCLYFEKHKNWNGIAIEPSLKQFAFLQKNRKCFCINAAITKNVGTKEFIDVIDGYTMMSGINDKSYYKGTLDIINKDSRSQVEKRLIQTKTFDQILNKNNLIDYLSIDVEGGEMEILESIDFNFYNIKVISVENNKPEEIVFDKLLKQKGFEYADKLGVDEIFYNRKYYNL
jgi:FkbM family methyltransferase